MRKVYTALKGDKNGSYVRIEPKTLEMVKYLACFAGDDLFGEDILFYTKGEFREFYKEPDDIQKIFLMMVVNFLIILFTFLLSYTGLLAYQGKKKARLAFNVGMAWAIVQGGRLFFFDEWSTCDRNGSNDQLARRIPLYRIDLDFCRRIEDLYQG